VCFVAQLATPRNIVTNNSITGPETEFVVTILELVSSVGGRLDVEVDLRYFSVIAALSERVVALDAKSKENIAKMDFNILRSRIAKARDVRGGLGAHSTHGGRTAGVPTETVWVSGVLRHAGCQTGSWSIPMATSQNGRLRMAPIPHFPFAHW